MLILVLSYDSWTVIIVRCLTIAVRVVEALSSGVCDSMILWGVRGVREG